MKKCEICDTEMVPTKLHGESFDIDLGKEINDFSIRYVNVTKEVKTLFGGIKEKSNYCESKLKVMVCTKCRKVELYIDAKDEANI